MYDRCLMEDDLQIISNFSSREQSELWTLRNSGFATAQVGGSAGIFLLVMDFICLPPTTLFLRRLAQLISIFVVFLLRRIPFRKDMFYFDREIAMLGTKCVAPLNMHWSVMKVHSRKTSKISNTIENYYIRYNSRRVFIPSWFQTSASTQLSADYIPK